MVSGIASAILIILVAALGILLSYGDQYGGILEDCGGGKSFPDDV